jgi:hypothetical protein
MIRSATFAPPGSYLAQHEDVACPGPVAAVEHPDRLSRFEIRSHTVVVEVLEQGVVGSGAPAPGRASLPRR